MGRSGAEDFAELPPAVWLRGDVAGLRAVVRGDAGEVDAWYEGSLALTPDQAEELLVASERIPWGNNPTIRLMIVSLPDEHVVGGLMVYRSQGRTSRLELMIGRPVANLAAMEREVLGLVVPWLLNEVGLMRVKIRIPADASSLIDAANRAGMRQAVKLREFVWRDQGRVDLLIFEKVNPGWGRPWKETRGV